MAAIRNQLRELRAQREMTQQDLADKVGVTRQTVIAIEHDKYSPSLETAFKVALVLGVPLEQCFQYDPGGSGRARWQLAPESRHVVQTDVGIPGEQ